MGKTTWIACNYSALSSVVTHCLDFTTVSVAFTWKKNVFWFKFHWNVFIWVNLLPEAKMTLLVHVYMRHDVSVIWLKNIDIRPYLWICQTESRKHFYSFTVKCCILMYMLIDYHPFLNGMMDTRHPTHADHCGLWVFCRDCNPFIQQSLSQIFQILRRLTVIDPTDCKPQFVPKVFYTVSSNHLSHTATTTGPQPPKKNKSTPEDWYSRFVDDNTMSYKYILLITYNKTSCKYILSITYIVMDLLNTYSPLNCIGNDGNREN